MQLSGLIAISVSLLLACSPTSEKETRQANPTAAPSPAAKVAGNRVLRVARTFSSPTQPDTFVLFASGDDPQTATCYFRIVSAAGDTLFRDQWPAHLTAGSERLTGYNPYAASGDEKALAVMQQQNFLHQVSHFFDGDRFHRPATQMNAGSTYVSAPEESPMREYWEALNAQPESIGFYYTLGEEDTRGIAWLNGKVVRFYNCC